MIKIQLVFIKEVSMIEQWNNMTNEELCFEYQKTKDNNLFEYFWNRNKKLAFKILNKYMAKYPRIFNNVTAIAQLCTWRAMCQYTVNKFSSILTFKIKDELRQLYADTFPVTVPSQLFLPKYIAQLNETMIFNIVHVDNTELDTIDDKNLENTISDKLMTEELYSLCEKLPIKEKYIIVKHLGLDGSEPKSFGDIATDLKISRQRVCELCKRAVRRLRYFARKEKLNDSM